MEEVRVAMEMDVEGQIGRGRLKKELYEEWVTPYSWERRNEKIIKRYFEF